MAFKNFAEQQDAVLLLQRSLEKGRLGHAYLFSGTDLAELAAVARTLAKTLNCENPPTRGANGIAVDCCDACLSCRKIDQENHPDVQTVRPESKSRIITIEQMRDLMQTVHLKPAQAAFKVAIIVAAERLNLQSANAFLKTLEEPPPKSILILLSTDPPRVLETILSRCLRLNLGGEATPQRDPELVSWVTEFSRTASAEHGSLLGRYRLLSVLLEKLNALREQIDERLSEQSPLERYDDIEPKLRDKWEEELTAAIEAEYRRRRGDILSGLQWWLRDVWLHSLKLGKETFTFPQLTETIQAVAGRISPEEAMQNLHLIEQTQRLLATNVQEALALEVGLLKLRL